MNKSTCCNQKGRGSCTKEGMKTCSKKGMEEIGDEKCPAPGDIVAYFTQIVLEGQCEIPEQKPDKEKILDIHHSIQIKKAITVDSMEVVDGQEVRGKKVVVAGFFKLGIEYIAQTEDQRVHFFHCEFPFQSIILDEIEGEDRLLPVNFNLDDYIIHICVEDLQVDQIDERTVDRTVVILIWLQPKRQ